MPGDEPDALIMQRIERLQSRRKLRVDEDGNTRIVIRPPAEVGDIWNGSAR